MASRFHPELVNDPFGDPGLYVELMFEKRAILFDLGDLTNLPSRKLLRISDVFVSHMHMDHFCGFDRLLRLLLGRKHTLRLYGPEGLIDAVSHKLAAYTWNLVDNYVANLKLSVSELRGNEMHTAEFACRNRFRRQDQFAKTLENGRLHTENSFSVCAKILDHDVSCLAFALEEGAHVNIWKNRIEEMGLRIGPWLRDLKEAVLRQDPDDTKITARWKNDESEVERILRLGDLRGNAAVVTPGVKIVYVVDAAPTDRNFEKIIELAANATVLFVESPFLHKDLERARDRKHLTAMLAGSIARSANVQRLVTLHYSPRYEGHGDDLAAEAQKAFREPAETLR